LNPKWNLDLRQLAALLLIVDVGAEGQSGFALGRFLEVEKAGDLAAVSEDTLGQAHALHRARREPLSPALVLLIGERLVAFQGVRPGGE
jgi:hypothetical protein